MKRGLGLGTIGVAGILVVGIAAAGAVTSVRHMATADFLQIPLSSSAPPPAASPIPSFQPVAGQKPAPKPQPPPNSPGCHPWVNTLTLFSFSISASGTGSVRVTWSASDSCSPPWLVLLQGVLQFSDGQFHPAHYQLPWLVGSQVLSFDCSQTPHVNTAQFTFSIQDGLNRYVEKAGPLVIVCR